MANAALVQQVQDELEMEHWLDYHTDDPITSERVFYILPGWDFDCNIKPIYEAMYWKSEQDQLCVIE